MTKIFCDKCGVELTKSFYIKIDAGHYYIRDTFSIKDTHIKKIICESCYKKAVKLLKDFVKKG